LHEGDHFISLSRWDFKGVQPVVGESDSSLGSNFTENAKPMSTATRGNDEQKIVDPATAWTDFLTGHGQENLPQQ
jgi:hypothetical protein